MKQREFSRSQADRRTAVPGKFSHSEAAGTHPANPVARPRELQDTLNFRIYHPLAHRLARLLAPTPITPNMVSVLGGLLVVCAGIAYAQPGWPVPALMGCALHLAWHVVDGADGDLARLTGRSSRRGEIIDGICDYASHFVLYLILGWILQAEIGPAAWLLAVSAGASRIAQANHYEVQRRQYQWWVYGQSWLGSGPDSGQATTRDGLPGAAYLALARLLAPFAKAADDTVTAARAMPGGDKRVQAIVKKRAGSMLRSLSLLGANYRTIALGVSMLAGSPLYFFLYEGVLLNIALVRSIGTSNRFARQMIATLAHDGASTRR